MFANRNQLWAAVVAQEIARGGASHVVLSPGSRSTPLALALHAQEGLRLSTHLDERSAAYFALGIGKATRKPAVLVCTSGTAAANYLPAIVEANQARIPLLVLTADRPPELRDVGANQAIDQQDLYGRNVRWSVDVGLPQVNAQRVRHLRALVCRAMARAMSAPAGPVHLNFPFQEPLEPTEVPGNVPEDWHKGDQAALDGRPGRPFVDIPPTVQGVADATVAALAKKIAATPDGVIIAGPRHDDGFADAVLGLAERAAYPIFADPLSGLRREDHPLVCATYDGWLGNAKRRASIQPRLILRLGAAPTSKHLLLFLRGNDADQIVVDEAGHFGEETARAAQVLGADPTTLARQLAAKLPPRRAARKPSLLELEGKARTMLAKQLPGRAFEGAIVRRTLDRLAPDTPVFVSSSLPIRDVDRFVPHVRQPLFANRGASGIDGVTSTALGVAHALGRKALLITGDLAFLHDLSALVAQRRLDIPLDILVLDNDGGGIFEFLPIARHEPPFTELFVTPHGTDLAAVGKALGLSTQELDATQALTADLRLGQKGPSRLVVVHTDRKMNVTHRKELEQLVDKTLERATEASPRVR